MSKSKTKTTHVDPTDLERDAVMTPVVDNEPNNAPFNPSPYPEWVLRDYEPSPTTYWGKRWPDGKEHLVPKKETVLYAQAMAKGEGATPPSKFRATVEKSRSDEISGIVDGFKTMVDAAGKFELGFSFMQGFSNTVTRSLAERIYRKYVYAVSSGRLNTQLHNENGVGGDEQPEWLQKQFDAAMTASSNAAMLVAAHEELWTSYMEYAGTPSYYMDNEITLRFVNVANFLDKQYRDVQPITAGSHAYDDLMNQI